MVSFPAFFINVTSIIIMGSVLFSAYRIRDKQAATELFIASLFMVQWSIGSFAEMISTTFAMKVVWRNITQIGVFMTPVATLLFILAYTDYLKRYRSLIARIAYTYQSLAVLLIFTDFMHHAVRHSVNLAQGEQNQVVVATSTALGSFLISGNFLLMLGSLVLTIIATLNSLKESRKQVYSVLLGMLVPLVYAFVKVVSNEQFLQMVPISGVFALSGLFMLLGIKRYDLLKLTPLAYEQTFRFLGDGIVVCSSEARVVEANPAARTMLGTSLAEIEEHLKNSVSHWHELVIEGRQTYFSLQFQDRVFHADLYPFTNKWMELLGSVILVKDVTVLEQQRLLLTQRAERDGLTGLYNRQTFIELVEKVLAGTRNEVHLLYFDIDHFKQINDMYGHRCGDYVLAELGKILAQWAQKGSIVGRFGGEEFAIFSSSIDVDQARIRANEFRQLVDQHSFQYEGLQLHITISLGLASAATTSFDALYHLADTLLYDAKAMGRNHLCSSSRTGQ